MKLIYLIVFLFSAININSQETTYIKGKGFEGYIFSKDVFIWNSIENERSRYTPTLEDINELEKLLSKNINDILKNQSIFNSPINKKTLKKYKRQYVGFITKDNEKIIWINFIWNKNTSNQDLSKEIIHVLDGGYYYWNVYINLTKKDFFNLRINNIAHKQ